MPILPFIYLIIAGGGKSLIESNRFQLNAKAQNAILCALLILLLVPSLSVHPHQISFFNRLVSGPSNGSKILIDSNIDWGQDLHRLKIWMDENEVERVNLGWFGTADPDLYQINHAILPGEPITRFWEMWWNVPFDRTNPPPGIYALSVTSLHEMPHQDPQNKTTYTYFRNLKPIDQIGYSIMIYEIK